MLSVIPPTGGELEGYLHARTRAGLTTDDVPAFREFLQRRIDGTRERLLNDGADILNNTLNGYVADETQGLRFVNKVEIDFQTPLGNRRGQGGLSALGALRETERDAIVWQLRGYAAEQDGKGANAGLIYRRAANVAGNSLFGGNVFLDFEKHGDSGETFLRWSLGGEYRNAYLDLTANRYFAISDAVVSGGETYYTAEGMDAELNVNLHSRASGALSGSLSGGLGYYNWEGIYGDKDDEGLRYHLRFLPAGNGLQLELQFDVPEEGDEEWGGRVAYRHVIGGATRGGGNLGGAGRDFDARGHFFDAARREYAQRIRTVESGAQAQGAAVQASAVSGVTDMRVLPATDLLMLDDDNATPAGRVTVFTRPLTVSLGVTGGADLQLVQTGAWTATVNGLADLSLYLETDGSSVYLADGSMLLTRRSGLNRVELFDSANNNVVTIDLYGTQCHFTAGANRRVVCDEGEVRVTLTGFADLTTRYGSDATIAVTYRDSGELVHLRLRCDSIEARARHRMLEGDTYTGCLGDGKLTLPVNSMATVIWRGRTVALQRGAADTEVKGDGFTVTIAGGGDLPLDLRNARILTPAGSQGAVTAQLATGETPDIDADDLMPDMTMLQLEAGASVLVTNVTMIAVLGGSVSADNPAALTIVSGLALDTAGLDFDGNTITFQTLSGEVATLTLTIGGGGGSYVFALGSGNEALGLVSVSGQVAVLTLSSATSVSFTRDLTITPSDEFALLFFSALTLTIAAEVEDGLQAVEVSEAVTVGTRFDREREVFAMEDVFVNLKGNISYESISYSDNSDDYLQVIATDGMNGVTVSLTINDDSLQATANVSVTIVAVDSMDNSKATLVIPVHVRHPGAVIADWMDDDDGTQPLRVYSFENGEHIYMASDINDGNVRFLGRFINARNEGGLPAGNYSISTSSAFTQMPTTSSFRLQQIGSEIFIIKFGNNEVLPGLYIFTVEYADEHPDTDDTVTVMIRLI